MDVEIMMEASKAKSEKRKQMALELAHEIAGQVWCTEGNAHKEMDPVLADAFAVRLAFWIETAAQNQENTEYYQGLLDQCANHIGQAAFTQDDGGISESPLRAKIPELVKALFL